MCGRFMRATGARCAEPRSRPIERSQALRVATSDARRHSYARWRLDFFLHVYPDEDDDG